MKNHYPLRVTVPFYYALQHKSSAAEYICQRSFCAVNASLINYFNPQLCFCIMAVQHGIHNPARIAYWKSEFMRDGVHDFIERLKRYISLTTGKNTERERKEILEEQRSEIQTKMKLLEESLERLNYKIHNYEKLLTK